MTDDDITESYLRANVGYTRATNSLIMASPLDMAGLPGVFQTLAVLLTGVTTIYRQPTYYNFAASNPSDAREISEGEWESATNGTVLGVFPPPLALVQVCAIRQRAELAHQYARVRRNEVPVDRLEHLKMSRLRLTLVDGNRIRTSLWTPDLKRCMQHPAWPGGHYQHELVWAYAEDGTNRPTWVILPHPTNANRFILSNNYTSHQYGKNRNEQFTLLMPLPKIFFYDGYRRHPDAHLTTPSSLLQYAIPAEADQPYLPQLRARLTEATPGTPRQPQPEEQGEPVPPPSALAPAKLEEVPEHVRKNWHTAMESFAKDYQAYPLNEDFVNNPSLLASLPCYWPLVRMTLNAKGVKTDFVSRSRESTTMPNF